MNRTVQEMSDEKAVKRARLLADIQRTKEDILAAEERSQAAEERSRAAKEISRAAKEKAKELKDELAELDGGGFSCQSHQVGGVWSSEPFIHLIFSHSPRFEITWSRWSR